MPTTTGGIEYPASTGHARMWEHFQTMADDIDALIRKPLVRLVQDSGTQNFTDGVDAAVLFSTGHEKIDTHGFHSETTNPSRVTPNLPGYYRADATFFIQARADWQTIGVAVYKNGGVQAPRGRIQPGANAASRTVSCTLMVEMNGTTDYLEMWGVQDNTANVVVASNAGGSFASVFEVEYIRPL